MQSTQWNPLTEVYLLSKFHFSSFCINGDFENGRFAYLEQFQIISHSPDFGKVKMDPICSFLLTLGRLFILLTFGKMLGCEKQFKPSRTKNSRTKHRIRHKSFSMIQSSGIKGWVPQLINRLQRFNLLLSSEARILNSVIETWCQLPTTPTYQQKIQVGCSIFLFSSVWTR